MKKSIFISCVVSVVLYLALIFLPPVRSKFSHQAPAPMSYFSFAENRVQLGLHSHLVLPQAEMFCVFLFAATAFRVPAGEIS
jgi:hypothetical protein